MTPAVAAYVGLGSNLGNPPEQLRKALAGLAQIPRTQLVAASNLYRSAPLGSAEQPDYVNAVAALETELSPFELLDALQLIENAQGRVRGPERWGPRTLDLDLLLYAERVIAHPRLTLPHPGIAEREFVLYPLAEIVAELAIPGHGLLSELLLRCPLRGLTRLNA